MKKCGPYAVLTIALGLLACSGKDKTGGGAGTVAEQQSGAGGQSLILTANQQGAFLPAELSDAKYADESTLPMAPFQLPAADFSKAGNEVEPNNTPATATPMGATLTIKGQIGAHDTDDYVFEVSGAQRSTDGEAWSNQRCRGWRIVRLDFVSGLGEIGGR